MLFLFVCFCFLKKKKPVKNGWMERILNSIHSSGHIHIVHLEGKCIFFTFKINGFPLYIFMFFNPLDSFTPIRGKTNSKPKRRSFYWLQKWFVFIQKYFALRLISSSIKYRVEKCVLEEHLLLYIKHVCFIALLRYLIIYFKKKWAKMRVWEY